MTGNDLPRLPHRAIRALTWLGFWLGAFALCPALLAWLECFHLRSHAGAFPLFPRAGSPRLWQMLGLCALMATLLSAQAWSSRKKPGCFTGPKTATPRERVRAALGVVALFAFLIVRIMAGHRGPPPNWPGVLGGAVGLGLLAAFLLRCGALALRPAPGEEPLTAPPPRLASSAPWMRPARNTYLAEKSATRVVYRRPRVTRIGCGVGFLFMAAMSLGGLWVALLALALIPAPAPMRVFYNPWLAVLMLSGCVLTGALSLQILSLIGPQELCVRPAEHTYTFRTAARIPFGFFLRWVDASLHDEGGIPWRTCEYAGPVTDLAGVEVQELSQRSGLWYFLYLRWNIPDRPRMRLGLARGLEDARVLQAEIAADLGLPALPIEAAS